MTQAHWFGNCCPPFGPKNLEAHLQEFGPDGLVSQSSLKFLGDLRSHLWLEKNFEKWCLFEKSFVETLRAVNQGEYRVLLWGDADYPQNLKTLTRPPLLLFYKGLGSKQWNPVISVVGARHPTEMGRLWVRKVIPELVKRGVCLCSGGARGVDSETHWATLKSGGHTICFLPGSIVDPYPRSHRTLFDKIAKTGTLVSEFLPGTPIRKENFQQRNRLIAGLGKLTVIVEASERSGTLMTARLALAENREIYVVPGSPLIPSYDGSLRLLEEGAGLAKNENDLIFALEKEMF